MGKIRTSGNPVMDLIIYRDRAMQNGFWLEAIALTHMFIETQLRIVAGLEPVRRKGRAPSDEKVIELAKATKKRGIIDRKLFVKIDRFNTDRNNALHNLALGKIRYDNLSPIARGSEELMTELQSLYFRGELGPQMVNDGKLD